MSRAAPSPFSLAVSAVSLLVTAVVAESVWRSYYPPPDRESLRRRKEHYEKVLLPADLSWQEGLYYKVVEKPPVKR